MDARLHSATQRLAASASRLASEVCASDRDRASIDPVRIDALDPLVDACACLGIVSHSPPARATTAPASTTPHSLRVPAWPSTRAFDRLLAAALPLLANRHRIAFSYEHGALLTRLFVSPTRSGTASLLFLSSFHALASSLRPSVNLDQLNNISDTLKMLLCTRSLQWLIKDASCADGRATSWTQFVSVLCSLPDKISNIVKGTTKDNFFESRAFTEFLIQNCLDIASVQDSDAEDLIKSASVLLSKLCRLNYYILLASSLVDRLDKVSDSRFAPLLALIDTDQLTKLIPCIIEQLAFRQQATGVAPRVKLESLFPVNEVLDNRAIQSILKDHSRLVKLKQEEVLILFDYCSLFPSDSGLHIRDVMLELVSLWASPPFASKSTSESNMSLTRSILLCVRFIDVDADFSKAWAQNLEQCFMRGMQLYMSSTVDLKRTRAMVLGEIILAKIRPDIPLSFELCSDNPEIQFLRGLVTPLANEYFTDTTEVPIGISSRRSEQNMMSEIAEEEDPDAPVHVANYASDDVANAEDTDVDLAPLPEADGRINSKKPIYIRDCVRNIRSEDPDVVEATLQVLSSLISSADPGDLSDLFDSLCPTLLNLQNTYELEEFELFIQEAFIAIGLQLPNQIAKFLNDALIEEERGFAGRMLVLRYMAFIVTASRNGNYGTRTQTQALKPALKTGIFSSSLPHFYFPLLDSFMYLRSRYLSNELAHNALMDSFLKTATLILKCSENTPQCLRMTRELFDLVLTIEYAQQDSSTRNSILMAFGIMLSVVPKHLFLVEIDGASVESGKAYLETLLIVENDEDRVVKARMLFSAFEALTF
ncbi:hypothetical protein BC830DRAFT_1128099 [Chytriomyces sp. MP71]|nr:hypothetical protein BC830DRAFT_1128099 [Chytriomyces sp. MP71]